MKIIFLIVAVIVMSSFITTTDISDVENDIKNESVTLQTEQISNATYESEADIIKTDPNELARQEAIQKMKEIESIEDEMEWFIAYKNVVNDYSDVLDKPETIYDYFTEEEIRLICKVVETEVYDQDFMSKVNVANVVLNRYYSGEFGETITEIVTAPHQFAYGRENITEDTILAVMFSYEIEDTTNGALYFHSNEKTDTFNGAKFIFQDSSGHCFYR